MDIIRRPYQTQCRFIAGQDPAFINWFPAAPGAAILPFPTVFASQDWEDEPWLKPDDAVGEIYGAARPFTNTPAIPGLVGPHYCGKPADFLGNAQPADPPATYLANGLPSCCPGGFPGKGGVEFAGKASWGFDYPCLITNAPFQQNIKNYAINTSVWTSNDLVLVYGLHLKGVSIGVWVTHGSIPATVQWRIGIQPNDFSYGQGTAQLNSVFQETNSQGFDVYLCSFTMNLTMPAGTKWMTLSRATASPNNFVGWDVSNGGSFAVNSSFGQIPSEYWCWDGDWIGPITIIGSGGVLFGGTATHRLFVNQTGSGGIEFGGEATVGGGQSETGSGGIEFGGEATQSGMLTLSGGGGVEFGGAATQAGQLTLSGGGGVEFGGAATWSSGYQVGATALTTTGSGQATNLTLLIPARSSGDMLLAVASNYFGTPTSGTVGWTHVGNFVPASGPPSSVWTRIATNTSADGLVVGGGSNGDMIASMTAMTGPTGVNVSGNGFANNSSSCAAPAETASGDSVQFNVWIWRDNAGNGTHATITVPSALTATGNVSSSHLGMGMNCGWRLLASGSSSGTQTATQTGCTTPFASSWTLLCH